MFHYDQHQHYNVLTLVHDILDDILTELNE